MPTGPKPGLRRVGTKTVTAAVPFNTTEFLRVLSSDQEGRDRRLFDILAVCQCTPADDPFPDPFDDPFPDPFDDPFATPSLICMFNGTVIWRMFPVNSRLVFFCIFILYYWSVMRNQDA